jgi:hypothetical protein
MDRIAARTGWRTAAHCGTVMKPSWYLHRLRRMSIAEIGWRARNMVLENAWRVRAAEAWRVPPGRTPAEIRRLPKQYPAPSPAAVAALLAAAEDVLAGRWSVFDVRSDLSGTDPDWSRNPKTGRAAPASQFCFDIAYRDPSRVGSVKHVWEVSRLHHITLLAAAFFVSDDERFATRAVAHLTSWWRKNPPLRGINWVSGIEMGLRLIGWVWTRRLLDKMSGIERIFEANPAFRQQLHAHQSWIATFHSRFSSANNHLIAEMAGLLSAALAFPIFAESDGWASRAASALEREVLKQTFADGMNRELASDYHVFVLHLLLIAGGEADFAGKPLSDVYWQNLCRMADALAALVDARGRPARQGDSDSGRALLLDAPTLSPVAGVLDTCEHVFEAAPWWHDREPRGVTACLLAGIVQPRHVLLSDRPARRPNSFPIAGITVLRDLHPGPDEIWCRLDHGPHGFLSTAAHAHADALSIEVREGGQEILIDPGTYCYHDERNWRDYFRSTLAHNTLEVGGRDQAVHAGPFLWLTQPTVGLTAASSLDAGEVAEIAAWHDGYATSDGRLVHHRRLTLERAARSIRILDWLDTSPGAPVRLAFHFHPAVEAILENDTVELSWGPPDARRLAVMTLPSPLAWRMHRGELDPILGWYSPAFGRREPSSSVIGTGELVPHQVLYSRIVFQGFLGQGNHAAADLEASRIPA